MKRRALLSALAGGTVALTGCLADSEGARPGDPASASPTESPSPTPRVPDDCPTTEGFEIAWPDPDDPSAVESFVVAYENQYYREGVVDIQEEYELPSYELSASADGPPTEHRSGYVVAVDGGGGVYHPTLLVEAAVTEAPAEADVVPASEFEDERVLALFDDAVVEGEAQLHVDDPGAEVARYVDLFESASDSFGPLTEPGDSDTLYVSSDERTLEVTVEATRFHGDYWWQAWYYVDAHVVRRTEDEDTDPRNGTLLECRTSTS